MEDLSKLSLADLISTLKYLEDIEYDINDFLKLAEKAREENIEEEIKYFNEMLPRIKVNEEDFFSPDKIKEMQNNLEIITAKISDIKKEIDKKLQLPTTDIKKTLKYFKEYIPLTDKTIEAYDVLKDRGEITKEMIRNSNASSFRDEWYPFNYKDEVLIEKFPIWAKVVRYLVEEKGNSTLTPKNYQSIQSYIKRFCIKL